MNKIELRLLVLLLVSAFCVDVDAVDFQEIVILQSCHPAVRSAAQILAKKMDLSEDDIHPAEGIAAPDKNQLVLMVSSVDELKNKLSDLELRTIAHDGYAIAFQGNGALICGIRPRSLLYAAGDFHLWKDRTSGVYVREPSFDIRAAEYHGSLPVSEYVAAMGINLLIARPRASVSFKETLPEVYNQLSEQDQRRFDRRSSENIKETPRLLQQCQDADVPYYALLYGNDFRYWSDTLYKAALQAYPSVQGKQAASSWEKATLCPSEEMTWKIIDAYLKEYMEQTKADGICATFWDNYGIFCQCDKCIESGMNKFSNQLFQCVGQYYKTLSSIDKKLIVRTWSSGVPHWLRDQWVHAPGYGHFGGSGYDLWSRVFKELPKEITIQTKVYQSDCQPDAGFSLLLGKASPHTEIAEYQISGQTRGRFYFPASNVNHTSWTMKKSHALVGSEGGVCVFPGGTRQPDYFLLDDITNSINVYAWRELSWDVNVVLDKVWSDWAVPIYGEKAAPHIIRALKLSEDAVNRTFSTLGMGSSTNSDFAGTIQRRETLLMYTNRHFLPEYAKYLEPTKENIQRVIEEKKECLRKIDEIFGELELAKPYLKKQQYDELTTRFDWFREFAIVKRYLEESLWRYRYLRQQSAMLTTDPEQMKYLAEAYDAVLEHQKKLFQYKPEQQFSCYKTNLGNLRAKPALGSPVPLMKELFTRSRECVEEFVGPDYLPREWYR